MKPLQERCKVIFHFFVLGIDHYCRTAFTILIKQILFKTKQAFSQAAFMPTQVHLEFHEARSEFTDQGEMVEK